MKLILKVKILIGIFLVLLSASQSPTKNKICFPRANLIRVVQIPEDIDSPFAITNNELFYNIAANERDSILLFVDGFKFALGAELGVPWIDARTKVSVLNYNKELCTFLMNKDGNVFFDDKLYVGSFEIKESLRKFGSDSSAK